MEHLAHRLGVPSVDVGNRQRHESRPPTATCAARKFV
jgi:hypothetical protein